MEKVKQAQKTALAEQIELIQTRIETISSTEENQNLFDSLSDEKDRLLSKYKKLATSSEYSELVLSL